jgi:hypothetical protein
MYKATHAAGNPSETNGGSNQEGQPNNDKTAENVTDAEFEEVK